MCIRDRSRAFTRPDLVSEKTRSKVLETADRLDFNISRSATALDVYKRQSLLQDKGSMRLRALQSPCRTRG